MIAMLHHLRAAYGFKSPEMAACLLILKHIRKQKPANLRHLTFNALKEIGKVEEDLALMRVLAVLAGPSYSILDQKFEFLDEEDDEYIDVDSDSVSIALNNGTFVHPTNGKPVHDFQSKIFSYYQLSESFPGSDQRTGE